MKALVLTLVASSSAFAQNGAAGAPAPAATAAAAQAPVYTEAQLLEEFGWYIGKRTGLADLKLTPAEADQMAKGIVAALNGRDSPYEIQKIGPAMSEFMQNKQNAINATIKTKNQGQSAAYFEKLKEDKNIVQLPSGLRYLILSPGLGATPKPTDTVKVNYTGTLIDGNVFDSSDRHGKPLEIELDKVIPGWTEGLQKIGKGGKIKLFIPPELGYGEEGQEGIPPGSVLVFDVELLDFTPTATAAAPAPGK